MPELDPVRQNISADAEAYLATLDRMITKAQEFAGVAAEMEQNLAGIGIAADDAGALIDQMAGRMNDARDAAAGVAAASGRAAEAMTAEAGAAGVAGSAMEQWAADQLRAAAEAQAAAEAAAAAAARIEEAYTRMASEVAASTETMDLSLDKLRYDILKTAAAGETAAVLGAAAMDDWKKSLSDLGSIMDGTGKQAAQGLGEAAAAADLAAASAQRTYTWWRLSGNAIHWIISGSAELLAVLIPATVAAGAWAFAWTQGAQNIYQHMTSLFTATEALGQASGQTMGEMLGLNGAWQKIQNEADVNVYQAMGAGLNILKESFGGLAQTGLAVGKIFDSFSARLVYDFSAAGGAGKTMSDLLSHMLPDLVGVGQFFGNLGAALASFASQMPGLAEVLLKVLDVITGGAKDILEFASTLHIGAFSILTAVMAFEEFNRWGSLVVTLLGKLGLASSQVSGGFMSFERAQGVFMNLFRAMPMLIGNVSQGLGILVGRLAGIVPGAEEAGTAMVVFGGEIKLAALELTFWQAALITAGAIGLGILIDKLATATTSAQKFGNSLQEVTEKASDLSVLSVIGNNMSILQGKIDQATASIKKNASGMEYAGGVQGRYSNTVTNAQYAYQSAGMALEGYTAAQVQQVSDAGQVVTGANQIAKAFGISVPAAMALAQSANVSLTGAVKNQQGQWTVLGEKVRDAYYGYQAMGQASGAIGNDMLALAIQTGEAGTKMSQLNQAWDSWMQTITGGTAATASFTQSMQNIGQVVGSVKNNLGEAAGISLSTKQFADALKGFGNTGAQAWTNFDQVVGSTAPQLIDWLRTAGTMGAVSGKQIQQAGLDMIAGLEPLAVHSKAAQTQLLALAQNAGANVQTFPQLEALVKSSGAKISGLNGITQTATSNLGSMAAAAQNLGDVMNTALTTAMSTAALKASGFDQAQTQLTSAIQKYGANSPQAEAAAQRLTGDWDKAQQMAGKIAQNVGAAQSQIDRLHGKSINIDVNMSASGDTALQGVITRGGGGGTIYTQAPGGGPIEGRAGGGFIDGFGTKTSDSNLARVSRGEFVMQAAAVDHYGLSVMNAMNAKRFAAGGPVGGGAGPSVLTASLSGGGDVTHMNLTTTSNLRINDDVLGTTSRKEALTYVRRNPQNNLNLRVR